MRRILVTGANKGIGRAIATRILEEHDDTFVLLGARSPERGRRTVSELEAQHPSWKDRLELIEIDVSSDASVKRAADTIAERHGRQPAPLYAVVNNAGIGRQGNTLKEVLEVNTVGMRRVCQAVLPLLDPSSGRIVNITSASGPSFVARCSPERQKQFLDAGAGWEGIEAIIEESLTIEAEGGDFEGHGLDGGDAYGLSKALSNTYTLFLAEKHPSLRINACTPGFIETDMTRPYAENQNKSPEEMGMKPPAQGARPALFLLFGEPEGNGRYYGSDAQRSPLDRYRSPGDPPYTGD